MDYNRPCAKRFPIVLWRPTRRHSNLFCGDTLQRQQNPKLPMKNRCFSSCQERLHFGKGDQLSLASLSSLVSANSFSFLEVGVPKRSLLRRPMYQDLFSLALCQICSLNSQSQTFLVICHPECSFLCSCTNFESKV